MLRKDYIQRQFEEFGKALALLLSLKLDKKWEEFEKEIEEAAKKFTSLELNRLEELSKETFTQEIVLSENLLPDQKKILANLLFEKMNYYLEISKEEKYQSLKVKCLVLYEHLQSDTTQNEFDLEVHYRLSLLSKS